VAKPVYKAASDLDFFMSMLYRLACFAAIVYLWFHYEENPPVIIVASVICSLLFLIIGSDEISVYPDKIIQKSTSIVSLFSKGRSYDISEIRAAYLLKEAASTADEAAIASFFKFIMPKLRHYKRNSPNIINLELKNGKIIQLNSALEEDKMEELAKAINLLV